MKFLLCLVVVLCFNQINCETYDEGVTRTSDQLWTLAKGQTVKPQSSLIVNRLQFLGNERASISTQTTNRVNDFETAVKPALLSVVESNNSNQEVVSAAQNAYKTVYNAFQSYLTHVSQTMNSGSVIVPYVVTALNRVDSNHKLFKESLKPDVPECSDLYDTEEILRNWESGSNRCMSNGVATSFNLYLDGAIKFIEIQNMLIKMLDVEFHKELSVKKAVESFNKVGPKSQSGLLKLQTDFDEKYQNLLDTGLRCHAKTLYEVEKYVTDLKQTRPECFNLV